MALATILVEDSQLIRESLIDALEEFANAEVIAIAETADDGIAALVSLRGVWRLAVIDLFLKEGNGLSVVRAVRTRDALQHVVVLTNYATAVIRQRSLEAGADAVFDKSTELDSFLALCLSYSEDLT